MTAPAPPPATAPLPAWRDDRHLGLSEAEAARRLERDGPNELPRPGRRGLTRIVLETLREPMFLLLMAATILYLVLGDLGEGVLLLVGALASIGLVVLQEARSERAMAALQELAQPVARVFRGGIERKIPARELVPGDILLVGEGERLPADAVLVGGEMLSVEESALTGESAPVAKRRMRPGESADPAVRPGVDLSPWLYAGCLVVRGQGVARVERTGARAALGQIGASLTTIAHEPTPLQRTAGRLVGLLGAFALAYCAVVAAAYGLLRGDWVGGVLAGVTAAIALIPEEFPMVLAVFLALGAWRLATHRVLVRRSAVIETLGGASVLCVDKTGTLTENRMRVAQVWTTAGQVISASAARRNASATDLLVLARLASALRPVDPMDRAIHAVLADEPADPDLAGEPGRTWPLEPHRLAVVQVWPRREGGWRAAAKGAPEAIFALCRMSPAEAAPHLAAVQAFAAEGLRVLGVADALGGGAAPSEPEAARFGFAGLVAFLDPLRPEVPNALEEARRAGVEVVMITGDHPNTALAIARLAGIDTAAGALLGAELATLDLVQLQDRLRRVRVFARIQPEQKLSLVRALKAQGHVVAMTGDGVNDAPALEAAHIGIAMGLRGSDVAREAADLVLLDDSFASIVGGVRLGRRIFANLRKALVYITAIHVPIAGLALIPILLGLPPLLYPLHVVVLELAVDPMCSLVFEGEPSEADAMRRPPRAPDAPLFGPDQLGLALLQGSGVLAAVLGLYAWALTAYPEPAARGGAFLALVLGNLVLALADSASSGRIFTATRWLYWTISGAAALILAAVYAIPPLADTFRVAPPDARLAALALAGAALSGGLAAGLKRLRLGLGRRTDAARDGG